MSQQIFWEKAPLSAPTWGKSLKSFFFLQCWGVVGWLFVGAGMEGLFFATGPVAPWMRRCLCSRRVRPRRLQAMVGGSSPPWSVFTSGLKWRSK